MQIVTVIDGAGKMSDGYLMEAEEVMKLIKQLDAAGMGYSTKRKSAEVMSADEVFAEYEPETSFPVYYDEDGFGWCADCGEQYANAYAVCDCE